MNKRDLTETDIRTKFITPALVEPAGLKWDVMTQVREEVFFTNGRVIVRGKTVNRAAQMKADYVLYIKPGLPIARVRMPGVLRLVRAIASALRGALHEQGDRPVSVDFGDVSAKEEQRTKRA